MPYTPDPERLRVPRSVVVAGVTFAAVVALFVFAPVIVRAAMNAPTAATCITDSECAMTPECRADSECDGGPQK